MIEIRIVCAHDAVNLAEMLTRLLEAEEHRVQLSYGRHTLHEVEDARTTRGAVLLIWSPNARSQTYMIEWARNIDPALLIEIAQDASDWPSIKRASGVIDFTNWRGQRGARCWKALNERLAVVTRTLMPPKPPLRTLGAIGAASLAAVSGAVFVGLHPTGQKDGTAAIMAQVAVIDASSGVGGPLWTIEPASMDDGSLRQRRLPPMALIDASPAEPLADLPELESFELRDPTLLERLNAYNPLRRENDDPAQ